MSDDGLRLLEERVPLLLLLTLSLFPRRAGRGDPVGALALGLA
jgi:hypothetical protein